MLKISNTYYFVTLFFHSRPSIKKKTPKTSIGINLKKTLLENILIAYGSVEQMNPSHFYAKATLLDPRYKEAAFMLNSNADTALEQVQYEVAELLRNRSK